MEYTTVREAAEKWGITVRQVQNLCSKGSISGAVHFGSCWAIPAAASRPPDGRSRASAVSDKDRHPLMS